MSKLAFCNMSVTRELHVEDGCEQHLNGLVSTWLDSFHICVLVGQLNEANQRSGSGDTPVIVTFIL
jgi:hypothetical protein